MKIRINWEMVIAVLLVVAFIVVTPRMLSGYTMNIVNLALIFAIASFGISVMMGMGGQLSFATVSFMGCGAYFIANVCTGRLGFTIATPLALFLTLFLFGILAFVIGLILFKLKGTYFTFATIGLVQVAYTFFNNYKPIFGGPDGIAGIPSLTVFGHRLASYNEWFYVLVAVLIVTAIVIQRIRISQLGRALASIRDNETAARTLGVNVYMTKVIAFTIAGILGAFAGALYSMHGKFVASDMFNYSNSTQFIIMAMLGGVNNTVGIIVGAILVKVLPEILRNLKNYMQLIWGVSIVLLMIFMPTGLFGLYSQIREKYAKKPLDDN